MSKVLDLKNSRALYLLTKMQRFSGLNLAELGAECQKRSDLASQRLSSMDIPWPLPAGSPNITLLKSSSVLRVFLANRPLSGVGFSSRKRFQVLLNVIDSVCIESDGKLWRHISATRRDGKALPGYDDMVWLKEKFIGSTGWAIQYFPPANEHISDHQSCLHLWHCLEGNPLPDFRKFGTI